MKKDKKLDTKKPVKKETKASKPEKKKAPTKVEVGNTLLTKDKYLPQKQSKVKQLKEKRWVAVIEKNEKEELGVVKLTTKEQANTTELKGYKTGNKKTTYFGHFVETEDNEGKPIKVDNVKFKKNDTKYNLTRKQVQIVKDKVLKHSKQASENNRKIKKLKKNPRD